MQSGSSSFSPSRNLEDLFRGASRLWENACAGSRTSDASRVVEAADKILNS